MGLRDLIARLRELPNDVVAVSTKVDVIEQQISDIRQFLEPTISSLASGLEAGRTATGQQIDELRVTLANGLNATENLLVDRLSLILSQMETLAAATSEALAGFEHRSSVRTGEISNAVNALHNAVLLGNNDLISHMNGLNGSLANAVNALHNAVLLGNNDLISRVDGLNGSLENVVNALHNAVSLGNNDIITRMDGLNGSLKADIAELEANFARRQGAMANEVNAIFNAVLPQTEGFHSIVQRIDQLASSFAETRQIDAALNMLTARGMSSLIARLQGNPSAKTKAVLPPKAVATLAEQMTSMKKIAPNNFAVWHKAYEAGVADGIRSTEGNLSHEGHIGAAHFRMFINVHARGRVLDIGCGPIAVPSYLNDWPANAIAGIDPQVPFESHPFPFAQSFAESIPWPDASFETVVIGTSLDHIYLLDQALAEIKRVLVPAGRLLIWTAMLDETPTYSPKGSKIIPPDFYHLFHPGRNWFYELLQRDYRLIERIPSVANAELLAYELKAS